MDDVLKRYEDKMKKTIAALEDGFAGLRTGRASAALFDKIRVDAYGGKSLLKEVANISVPEARLVVIQPWDKAMLGEIEKAIRTSELSLNPSNDGKLIRISIPPLTGDRRKELVKQAKTQSEQARVAIRNIRRDGNDELKKLLKDSDITEDEESKISVELQKLTDRYISIVDKSVKDKEKEITEV
ncbi:MAG: ribosome recycling factor [Spirochaetaceae bacterium]|jgi:ribosome recycling factor|nr:ribosome recycling factor [Spirochaetaceae bacterium]